MFVDSDLEQRIKRIECRLEPKAEDQVISDVNWIHLNDRMTHFNIPGVSVAVINGCEVDWAKGYGWLENDGKNEVTPASIFHACSMSKFVTAMAVLKLVTDKVIDLDEPVNEKLSVWKITQNEFTYNNPVTLRHLLSHHAGIIDPENSFGIYLSDQPLPSLLQILQGSTQYNPKPVQVSYKPASKFEYSDAGFCVIEQLLIEITGKSFDNLLQELIFEPLGMKNSFFKHAFEFVDTDHIAVGHDKRGQVVEGRRATYPYLAAAGLWSTPTDLGLLIIELHRILSGSGKTRISKNLAKELLTGQECTEWAGLGVFLGGKGTRTRMNSLGWGIGFQCMLAAYPYQGSGVVVMTNSEPGFPQDKALTGEFVQSVEREYRWETF
ncbi:MAG: serine hydrolase domain-containing protein [Ardenticatenaceae bacterium]|nr:serine hydrolase domain-containing protein [Ardenticatenaceae bacterium]